MVHYIRFLRTPHVADVSKKGVVLSAVLAVTTDLGDAYLASNATLIARVVDAANSGQILYATDVPWTAYSRAAKLNMTCPEKLAGRLVCMHVTTKNTILSLENGTCPHLLDVWSQPFVLKNREKTDSLVQRRIPLSGKSTLCMWEETGDSIARHLWDASLACCGYLSNILAGKLKSSLSLMEAFLHQPPQRVRVLEVGAGCGVVGVAFAQLCKGEAVLTDLEDAQDILQSNIDCAAPLAGSSLRRQVLGWGLGLETLSNPKFDLVLVSDCIYNPDSSVLLVETLAELASHNPNILVFVAYKRRHDADDVFFAHMRKTNLIVAESDTILLPHTMTDYDASEPQVELFVYKADPTK